MAYLGIGSYIIVLLSGIFILAKWRKKKDDPDIFFFCSCWLLLSLISYLGILELTVGTFYLAIPLFFLSIFLISYFKEKARLLNGLLFNLFLLSLGVYLIYNTFKTNNIFVLGLLLFLLAVFFIVIIFGIFAAIVFLYWNALIVFKKESHSLANLLTFVLAIVLTLLLVLNHFVVYLPQWVSSLLSIIPLMMAYFFIVFLNFLSVSILYQFNHPRYKQDYIIVLGAGLMNGMSVSPLLGQRIDQAISFYQRQIKSGNKPPKILMSGGQGPDEKLPEAVAMKEYACNKNIPPQDILIETNSTTTFENMKFSKEIMDHRAVKNYRVIFTSNNYHIFRAGIYARLAGLKADGIGAKTARYYLPNAFLREYLAIIMMHKKRHFIFSLLLAIGIVFATLINQFFTT